jgi:hypothetical protein
VNALTRRVGETGRPLLACIAEGVGFAPDSPLEGTGFEPLVPLEGVGLEKRRSILGIPA